MSEYTQQGAMDKDANEALTLADTMDSHADEFDRQVQPDAKENRFRVKYEKASESCRNQMERMVRDLRKTEGNPYIRASVNYQYAIYRDRSDGQPVDVYNFERNVDYSLMSYLLAGAIVTGIKFAFNRFRLHL